MSSTQKINVPALGRTAKFGDIYDARKNEFAGINVFTTRIQSDYIDTDENPNTSYKFSYAAKESEKMDAFDIQGELKLRIWCGLIKVQGSAGYIKNSRNSRKSIQCNYILKSTTLKESFNWRLKELSNSFDFSGIEDNGTHMVVGIQYGGNGVVALTYTCNENQETEEVKGKLEGKFTGFPSVSGSLGVSGRLNNTAQINDNELNVKVDADVSIEPSDDITSVEGAKTFMRHLGGRLKKYNDGKGVKVSFELIPIKTVVDFFKLTVYRNVIYKTLQSHIINTISYKLNEIEDIQEELNERIFELQLNRKYFTPKEIEWWREEELKFNNTVVEIHSKIDNILKSFQDEIPSANNMLIQENNVIAELKRSVSIFVASSERLVVKSFFIKSAEGNDIKYVYQENQLAQLKLQNKKLYICFFSAQNYHDFYNLLRNFAQEDKDADMTYVMVDAEILSQVVKREFRMENLPRHPLYIYADGKYVVDPKTKKPFRKHSVSVGIDLGTTNSCVAVYSNNGVEVLANDLGHKIVPSYVLLDGSIAVVGEAAKKATANQYDHRIYDAKRMLGKKYNDPSIQKDKKSWPFEIGCDKHESPIIHVKNYKNEWVYPENISALVLGKMKEIVETYHLKNGEKITDAVITVPAYFNDSEREATKHAAKLAGLNVLKLLNEPSAAGLAFCYHRQEFRERTVLVYDFGGGTFDVSIMRVNQGRIEVLATDGNTHLGGNDFDENLVRFCCEKLENGVRSSPRSMRKLKQACVIAKEHLSNSDYYEFEILNLYDGKDFEHTITRQDFERICKDLFDETMRIVKKSLNEAKLLPSDVDEVLLVGGSSRIPKVQEMLSQLFGHGKISKRVNPDEAVAYGAAIQAAILTGEIEKECNIVLMDITPLPLGIASKSCSCTNSCECPCKHSTIISKNSKIPALKSSRFQTSTDNQITMSIRVLEGESYYEEQNHKIGEFTVTGIPKNTRGLEKVDIIFDLDGNGMLSVTAKIVSTGRQANMVIEYFKKRLSRNE